MEEKGRMRGKGSEKKDEGKWGMGRGGVRGGGAFMEGGGSREIRRSPP